MTLTYTDGEPVQIGDRVTVEGVVAKVSAPFVYVETPWGARSFFARDIVSHSSPPIKAGDMVTSTLWDGPACVKCVDGNEAWILLPSGARSTFRLPGLRRVTP